MVGAGPELGLIFQRLFLSLSPKSAWILLCPHPQLWVLSLLFSV